MTLHTVSYIFHNDMLWFSSICQVLNSSVVKLFSTSSETANSYSSHSPDKQWLMNHLLLHLPSKSVHIYFEVHHTQEICSIYIHCTYSSHIQLFVYKSFANDLFFSLEKYYIFILIMHFNLCLREKSIPSICLSCWHFKRARKAQGCI